MRSTMKVENLGELLTNDQTCQSNRQGTIEDWMKNNNQILIFTSNRTGNSLGCRVQLCDMSQ